MKRLLRNASRYPVALIVWEVRYGFVTTTEYSHDFQISLDLISECTSSSASCLCFPV